MEQSSLLPVLASSRLKRLVLYEVVVGAAQTLMRANTSQLHELELFYDYGMSLITSLPNLRTLRLLSSQDASEHAGPAPAPWVLPTLTEYTTSWTIPIVAPQLRKMGHWYLSVDHIASLIPRSLAVHAKMLLLVAHPKLTQIERLNLNLLEYDDDDLEDDAADELLALLSNAQALPQLVWLAIPNGNVSHEALEQFHMARPHK